jgi:hypothetical protein
LDVTTLSAISADLGSVTAGSITGVTITGSTISTSAVTLDASGINLASGDAPHLRWGSGADFRLVSNTLRLRVPSGDFLVDTGIRSTYKVYVGVVDGTTDNDYPLVWSSSSNTEIRRKTNGADGLFNCAFGVGAITVERGIVTAVTCL